MKTKTIPANIPSGYDPSGAPAFAIPVCDLLTEKPRTDREAVTP